MTRRAADSCDYVITITDANDTVVTGALIGDLILTAVHNGASYSVGATLTELGSGRYLLSLTMPSTAGSLSVDVVHSTSTNYVFPGLISEIVELYDNDAIAALLTTTGVATGEGIYLADVDLGDVVVGDAWTSTTLTVLQAILSTWGYADCTGFADNAIQASIRLTPGGTVYAIDAAFSDKSANEFTISWDSFPAALKTAIENNQSTELYLDVQLIDSAITPDRIFTIGRYRLTALWEREIREAVA